ncbi:MAG: cytochrome B [Calditrichaeota bacterium]|nr:cytochrome B [Calditrichota bacterium]
MKKLYLYPLWLRVWHWTNATLYILLILTGISMHYSGSDNPFIPFKTARLIHNTAGILLVFMYLDFLINNLFTWNGKYYLPQFKGLPNRLYLQTRYYLFGIFKGEPHPFNPDEKSKFNPLQQVTYIFVMFVFMPVLIISGLFLLFPEYAPDKFLGIGGLLPMAILHTVVAYFLTLFTIAHIYLGTTGHTPASNFKSMIGGYHIITHEDHSKKEKD